MGIDETIEKLETLAPYMEFEQCSDSCGPQQRSTPRARTSRKMRPPQDPSSQDPLQGPPQRPLQNEHFIHHALLPGGKTLPMLKTLLTAACERDCNYCPFRAGRDTIKPKFTPDELAAVFDRLYRKRAVEGIFLSSALSGGGVRTQDGLIKTAEILREHYRFEGYIHLKLMPGAEHAQIERSMQLADRVSVNLEAPTRQSLARLAPHKRLVEELVRPLLAVEQIRSQHTGAPGGWRNRARSGPSQTTQFVVGPGGETDKEIIGTVGYLRKKVSLARTYFSAFSPVRDTPFEGLPAESPMREHRLYQCDFLLRDYGFAADELAYGVDGNLSLAEDPKLAWARIHLAEEPIELNTAEQSQLLRVPGIGPVGARHILAARKESALREMRDLRALGVIAKRAAPFVLLKGRRPDHQMALW
ncbi:MAG: radical SAM protein [Coriobacteriia bacterium]|nr:radical SAM protein [Coriobacteriia bacterium]